MNEEIITRASMMQNETQEIENNLKIINDHILELRKFNEELSYLQSTKESEVLAPLGKGVFIKSKIGSDNGLFVEVGAGVVVEKSPAETKDIIESQIRKFEEGKMQLMTQLEFYKEQFKLLIEEIQKGR